MLLNCSKEKYYGGVDNYTDGFESYFEIDSLIDGDNLRWSFLQLTRDENYMIVDTSFSHLGGHSIQFNAVPSDDDGASKCIINKQKMAFWEGEIVSISAWYYLEGEESAEWLFIMDLEENTAIGAGPGMRLAIVDDKIRVEHKFLNPDIKQTEGQEIDFPRNQWVNIRFETLLSKKEKGWVKVYQDDVLIIEQDNWKTQPTDILYGVQGTKGIYSNIEFGLTANTKESTLRMWVDDIDVKLIE